MTEMFRVAVNKQQCDIDNFIVVTCSPQYNGVWKYDGSLHRSCGVWPNGKTLCYEIPIKSCTFVKSLDEMTDKVKRKMVADQQWEWFTNQVKNRNYTYSEKPDWFVEELKNRNIKGD
jgi:hypothetical protein